MSEISRTKLAAYTVGALAVGAVVAGLIVSYLRGGASPGDDQPPIIVRDGSVIFEGGDSQNPKKGQDSWVQMGSNQHWKGIKNNGHSVASFTVFIAGVVDPGCPQTTMPGDAVEVDYTDTSAQPTTLSFHVVPSDDGNGHKSPQVNADDQSGLTAGTTGTAPAPPQLLAGAAGKGYISKVIATDSTGGPTLTCNLPQPLDANRSLVRVTIVPERQ